MARSSNGFTLVEVSVAIAIFAFVFVTLIGLLDVGFSTEKASLEDARVAALSRYVMATESTNSFANVCKPSYSSQYYFDASGDVTNVTPPASYYISCTVTNLSGVANNAALLVSVGANTSSVNNIAPLAATFIYPRAAPAAKQKTNVFFFNRSNE